MTSQKSKIAYICPICSKRYYPFLSNISKGYGKYCSILCYSKVPKSFKTHGLSRTRFYRIWYAMKNRCLNPLHSKYANYGGRGIKILWTNFNEFNADMSEAYIEHCKTFGQHNTSLDRINNNSHYSKENCRWATQKIQCNNSSNAKTVTYNNETHSIKEWSEKLELSYPTLQHRIKRGWTIERALTTPKLMYKS